MLAPILNTSQNSSRWAFGQPNASRRRLSCQGETWLQDGSTSIRSRFYEAGAVVVALLAYPDESEETLGEVHASLCAYALKAKSAMEPDWDIRPLPIKPIYALRPQRDTNRYLRTLERRLRDRSVAGRMAIGFLKEAVTGQVPAGID